VVIVIPTRAWPDKYGRTIAAVYDLSGRNIGLQMVLDGYATDWRRGHNARINHPIA
jgi:endonuclease YncB( thermonuclease family)